MPKRTLAGSVADQVTALGLAATPGAGFTPANPASTTSQAPTLVMMGLGASCQIIPSNQAPLVLVIVTGVAATATAAAAVTVGGRYGTGTAPANGAAVTGTRFGAAADPVIGPAAGIGAGVPFTLAAVLSLTPGAKYWFDLAVATAASADAASISAVGVTIAELP